MSKSNVPQVLNHYEEISAAICQRLGKNQRVRRTLPGKGRLRMDRQLPFLCVYRSPTDAEDAGTRHLVTSEAAYLFSPGDAPHCQGLDALCRSLSMAMQEHFGAFLFLEVWSQPTEEHETLSLLQPHFEIVTEEQESLPATVEAFADALAAISIGDQKTEVEYRSCDEVTPPGLKPLMHTCPDEDDSENAPEDTSKNVFKLGLAVRPIYRDAATGTLFPMVLQSLRSQLALAIRKAMVKFAAFESIDGETHFESLGPTSLVKAVRLIDQQLCEVSDSFDFLLQTTPTNSEQAWEQFKETEYQVPPSFYYRPLPYDPNLLKRRLFDIEIERIEDPTLAYLFWEKQEELDRQLSALRDLNTPHFLYGSLQLYGEVDDTLAELADSILKRDPRTVSTSDDNRVVDVRDVAARAREEIDYYHQRLSEFNASVEVCDHIASGIMVSRDKLLISENVRIRHQRLTPLLHHEVGTHLLTYFNGRRQPFRQLYAGLAGYEELQEGLAVMAEYLSGGLSPNRLRNLAGRVIAVKMMCDDQSFLQTFDRLHETYGFAARQSFVTTLRAFRGGGLTKDIIYLRGLRDLLQYLEQGHDIEPLYVGKIGLHHLPYIQEMRRRGVIEGPSLLPRFWDDPELRERLEASRGMSILELMEKPA